MARPYRVRLDCGIAGSGPAVAGSDAGASSASTHANTVFNNRMPKCELVDLLRVCPAEFCVLACKHDEDRSLKAKEKWLT